MVAKDVKVGNGVDVTVFGVAKSLHELKNLIASREKYL